jgi:hypothetical protein
MPTPVSASQCRRSGAAYRVIWGSGASIPFRDRMDLLCFLDPGRRERNEPFCGYVYPFDTTDLL